MSSRWVRGATACGGLGAAAVIGYAGVVTGAVPLDVGIGRRYRPLGPISMTVLAPRELVFEVIAAPYLRRQTRAIAEKITVLERGTDLVLAAHRTPVRGRLVATTVETVRFTRPERIDFRLIRGPVPHVTETFTLTPVAAGTSLEYTGRLGTDLWWFGQRWGDLVAARWNHAVRTTFTSIKTEAERRTRHGAAR